METDAIDIRGLQLVLFIGAETRELELPSVGTLSIGRGEDCAVRINDGSVSRHHALLHVGSTLLIEDLGSSNGTRIHDREEAGNVTETLNLRHIKRRKEEILVGDILLFGSARATIRHSPNSGNARLSSPDGVVVRDPAMLALYARAELAASASINLLLLGETGVGKEVLARVIHAKSSRASQTFRVINCAALSDTLLESELFGHEKGAFTGALRAHAGLFEAAAGGTILLDEIGETAPTVQAKLLRVIEQREVMRLGSNRPTTVDVRVLAATNRDLEADIQTGRFRQDLFFRLNGLSLWIPPLRERPLEIEHMARTFLATACGLIDRDQIPSISVDALECLRAYAWPGNVRELRHAMERAAILCRGEMVTVEHLPTSVTKAVGPSRALATSHAGHEVMPLGPENRRSSRGLPAEVRQLERKRIVEALEQSRWSQSRAARLLGISRGTLISRIEDYGLPRPRRQPV